ncbi:uncharacterized protein TNCV_1634911 [Trichonephila clavipes]|nr:uncharacterized protein TNCV_1634911 [Trichonephila clavipes]
MMDTLDEAAPGLVVEPIFNSTLDLIIVAKLGWFSSNKLGCGIRKCDDVYLIVCHYFTGRQRGVRRSSPVHIWLQSPPPEGRQGPMTGRHLGFQITRQQALLARSLNRTKQRLALSTPISKWSAPSWKYTRNLESPKVSSPGFGNDSKMMVMLVDGIAQVAPELQRRMRTGIWQLLSKETDGAQYQTCLVSTLQLPVRQFQGRPCTDA